MDNEAIISKAKQADRIFRECDEFKVSPIGVAGDEDDLRESWRVEGIKSDKVVASVVVSDRGSAYVEPPGE